VIDRILLRLAAMGLALLGGSPGFADEPEPAPLNRQLLLEKPTELASSRVNAKVLKVIFPPAYKTPLHTHEGPGPRYVVRGRIKMEESGQTHVYGPGEVFWESGQWMTVENVGGEDAEVLIVELGAQK
jgi:quercetin dioxygenase-like cupin family protein